MSPASSCRSLPGEICPAPSPSPADGRPVPPDCRAATGPPGLPRPHCPASLSWAPLWNPSGTQLEPTWNPSGTNAEQKHSHNHSLQNRRTRAARHPRSQRLCQLSLRINTTREYNFSPLHAGTPTAHSIASQNHHPNCYSEAGKGREKRDQRRKGLFPPHPLTLKVEKRPLLRTCESL